MLSELRCYNLEELYTIISPDVNECASNPCRNGAICLNGMGQYVCQCRDTYTGYDCERSEFTTQQLGLIGYTVPKDMS